MSLSETGGRQIKNYKTRRTVDIIHNSYQVRYSELEPILSIVWQTVRIKIEIKFTNRMHVRDDHNVHDLAEIYFNKHELSLIFAVASFSKRISYVTTYYAPIQK